MPWELVDTDGNAYRLPATIAPAQKHVGGSPNQRFLRGYGSDQWFVTLPGEREPQTLDLVGVLFTDRDETLIQELLDELSVAAATAARLYHLDENGARIEYLPLNGSLPLTTTPDGVDGTLLSVTVPLVPASAEWLEAEDEPDPDPEEHEYQVFTESGVWDWEAAGQPDTVDVLVVAGGGAGGYNGPGGGGGAGGVVLEFAHPVTGDVSVTVGAGGAGSTNGVGNNGQNSAFGTLTAIGGGGGSGFPLQPAAPGGSGGGGGGRSGTVGGAGTPGQGHAGGNARTGGSAGNNAAGGGGGYAGPGGDGTGELQGGDGGAGLALASIGFEPAVALGAPASVAGGGGGGADGGTGSGGLGKDGGGNGGIGPVAVATPGAPATANTGGGGGGGGNATNGGAGGSGLVIVRWARANGNGGNDG